MGWRRRAACLGHNCAPSWQLIASYCLLLCMWQAMCLQLSPEAEGRVCCSDLPPPRICRALASSMLFVVKTSPMAAVDIID
jgi:hypothetical protein